MQDFWALKRNRLLYAYLEQTFGFLWKPAGVVLMHEISSVRIRYQLVKWKGPDLQLPLTISDNKSLIKIKYRRPDSTPLCLCTFHYKNPDSHWFTISSYYKDNHSLLTKFYLLQLQHLIHTVNINTFLHAVSKACCYLKMLHKFYYRILNYLRHFRANY